MIFSLLFLSLIPIIISLILIIPLSVRKAKKWYLKPFYSSFDVLNELFAISSTFLFNVLSWKAFLHIIRDLSGDSSWPIEVMFFATILTSLIFGIFIRSYLITFLGVVFAYIFTVVEIFNWGFSDYFLVQEGSLSPMIMISISWLLLNLLYVLGKFILSNKKYARVGNLLRFSIIGGNTIFLGVFSSYWISGEIETVFEGQSVFNSPILALFSLVIFLIMAFFGLVLSHKKFDIVSKFIKNNIPLIYKVIQYTSTKLELGFWEFCFSIIPPSFLFIIANIAALIGFEASQRNYLYNNSYNPTNFGWLWLVIFNFLFFGYLIYLVIKSGRKNEVWLKVYAIILLIFAILFKFFDFLGSFSFNGIFFIFLGLSLIGAVFGFLRFQNKKDIIN